MINIWKLFKLDPWTYGLLLIAFLCGFFKQILLILLIVVIHELGHIIMLNKYEIEIISVKLYPFGGITKVNKDINTPLKKEIIIAISGVIAQCFLWVIFYLLHHYGYLYSQTYFIFKQYNITIMLFNLLPMVPLDGSIIFRSILEKIFAYEKAYKWYFIFSFITLFFFSCYNIAWNLNNYLILFFLLFQLILGLKHRKFYIQKFYLERYLKEFPYTRIKNHEEEIVSVLKKDTLHFFKKGEKYRHERELLREKFDNHTYF